MNQEKLPESNNLQDKALSEGFYRPAVSILSAVGLEL